MKPGYSEQNGLVVLAMTKDDYNALLGAMGYSRGLFQNASDWIGLVNRLNDGNPRFVPYEVPHADPR